MKKYKKIALMISFGLMLSLVFATPVFAAGGDVAGAGSVK